MTPEEKGEKLGAQIKAVRKAREWTQEQLAELCDVKKAQISRIEGSTIYASTNLLFNVCEVLGPDLKVEDVIYGVNPKPPLVRFYPTREAVYAAIPQIIHRVEEDGGEKRILLAALHGYIGKREREPRLKNPALEAFDKAMNDCITSPSWRVSEIYNVTNRERLEVVVDRVRNPEATKYEVRAFSFPDMPQALSPLIIGEEDALIAIDDPNYFRVRYAIHFRGRECVAMAAEYFDSLCQDEQIVKLRSEKGIDKEGIKRLRSKIKEIAQPRGLNV